MTLTKLEEYFKSAIDELSVINGRIYALSEFINKAKIDIEGNFNVNQDLLMGAGLSFRDITLKVGSINLFMPPDYYKITYSNLTNEVLLILSRECLLQISQSYELLETFLYNQVAEFISLSKTLHIQEDFSPKANTFASIRTALKILRERKNNRHLLKILRDNIPLFKEKELCNIYDFDFIEWYELISEVRHCVTHNRAKLTPVAKKALSGKTNDCFEIKIQDGYEFLFVTVDCCKQTISRIAEYIFFTHKAISEAAYNIKINFGSIQHIYPDPYNSITPN